MFQNHEKVNMGFTNEEIHTGIHICLIYNKKEERQKIISQYLKSGVTSGEMVIYTSEPKNEINSYSTEPKIATCFELYSTSAIRVSGEMSWILKSIPSSKDLIEYESPKEYLN